MFGDRCSTCDSYSCENMHNCDEYLGIANIILFCKTAPNFDAVLEKYGNDKNSGQLFLCWKAAEVLSGFQKEEDS